MKKASIYFRTRGGPNHGWGNIHRLANFAMQCINRGHDDIVFFVEGPVAVTDYLKQQNLKAVAIPEDISVSDERDILANYKRADVIICEMLECCLNRQAVFKKFSSMVVIFDDLLDNRYNVDLVISAQALPAYGNIEISSPKTKFEIGYKYFMMSSDFLAHTTKTREHSNAIDSILIAFGGGSYDAAYLKSARAIFDQEKSFKTTFVLGYDHNQDLADEILRELPGAIIIGGVNNMAELMAQSDLAIVSAGYLKLEAAVTRTPTILIATQWHQIPLAMEYIKHTNVPFLGYKSFVTSDLISQGILNLKSKRSRERAADQASGITDGLGFERVYNLIFKTEKYV